jgi:hypothetical protein
METIDFLRRHIERNEWQAHNGIPGTSSALPLKWEFESEEIRYEAWLTESLLTGLITYDRLIAYRCSLQAASYREHLKGKGGSMLSDAFLELRNRVESMLK